jgi:hypothetical protein
MPAADSLLDVTILPGKIPWHSFCPVLFFACYLLPSLLFLKRAAASLPRAFLWLHIPPYLPVRLPVLLTQTRRAKIFFLNYEKKRLAA